MEKNNDLTKVLAVAGTLLVWFPILAPVLVAAIVYFVQRIFRFDFLMPAELFPFALAGSGLLLWAALRVHARVRPVAWGLGLAVLMLFGGQGLAVVTGLASGKTEPTGLAWGVVLASLVLYTLGILLVAMNGVLLLKGLFGRKLSAL